MTDAHTPDEHLLWAAALAILVGAAITAALGWSIYTDTAPEAPSTEAHRSE